MNKTKLIPFDIEKAKNGAKIVTRIGKPVRVEFYDVKNKNFPILCFFEEDNGKELPLGFTKNGKYHKDENIDSSYDLFIEEEVENDYKNQDESIRKALISYFQNFPYNSLEDAGIDAKDAIAWLKGQGEQKPVDYENIDIQQKVEIKFKVGDFIANDYCMGKVIEITNDAYLLDTGQGIPLCDNTHRWSIQDAKPGDILATKNGYNILIFKNIKSSSGAGFSSYYNYNNFSDYSDFKEGSWNRDCFIPATKEQRELLFNKMEEAGYEWDAENKELKKINKEVKNRLMTNQELSDWLYQCQEEHREVKYKKGSTVYKYYSYFENEANDPTEDILIRKNHGEWEEPLVEE